jgi:hypothetical protein
VFFDIWTLLGIIVSAVSLYFLVLRMVNWEVVEVLRGFYDFYSVVSRYFFDYTFFFIDISVPQGIKDSFLTYVLVGLTTFRSHSAFLKLGRKEIDRKVIDDFVYEHSPGIFGFLLNPLAGRYERVQSVVAKLVCLFLWPFILISGFEYTGVKTKDISGRDDLAVLSSLDYRSIVIVQLSAVIVFALSFLGLGRYFELANAAISI